MAFLPVLIASALPAMVVVAPLPANATATLAKPWCDMGAHIAQMQPVAMAEDPVFRRPTPAGKAALGAVRKELLMQAKGPKRRRAIAQLGVLFASKEGPVLARLALQDASIAVRLPALHKVLRLAPAHPRLASFAGHDVSHKDPAVATAAAHVLLASGCDTAGSYALDALAHNTASVRLTAALAAIETTTTHADMGQLARVLEHIDGTEKDAATVAAITRRLGQVGWLPAAPVVGKLRKHTDATVRCEASVAHARITARHDEADVKRLIASKSPYLRVCAARILASGATRRAIAAIELLKPLLRDKSSAVDPLNRKRSMRVSAAAAEAIGHLSLSGDTKVTGNPAKRP